MALRVGSCANDWARIVDSLPEGLQAIAIDMRGHGDSDKPHDVTDYGEKMVVDVIRLLDHLHIEKAHLVGYSMGGFVLMKLMVAHPERVSSAVFGGTGGVREDFPLYEWANAVCNSMDRGKPFLKALDDAQPLLDDEKEIKGPDRGWDTKALAAVARGWKQLAVQNRDLTRIKIPALVIYGSDEVDANLKYIEGLKEIQPAWTYYEIRGADHETAYGHEEFIDKVNAFLIESTGRN